jgi:acetyl esterase/lipase
MMSVLGFLLALVLLGAARFCVQPARTYRAWWVALVATELGHVGVVLALGLAGYMAVLAARAAVGWEIGLAALAAALAVASAGLYARPAWLAWRLSRRVASELETAFAGGAGGSEDYLWSWSRLWCWPNRVERGPVETFVLQTGTGSDACAADEVSEMSAAIETGRGNAAGGANRTGLPLDFYRARGTLGGALPKQDGRASTAVCVVVVHGGGWDSGDRGQLAAFNHWLAGRGVAVVAVSYRLAPAHRWPAQRDDVKAAVDWVRANAPRLGVDANRLVLLGRSAGAQIAAATAYGQALPGVRAVVALYGCYDLEFVWSIRSATDSLNSDKLMQQFMGGGPEGAGAAEVYRSGSAEKLVHAGVPPTLILHGALDQLVWCRHSERLAAALARAGVRHAFVRLPWATHAGDANLHGPAGQLIAGAVLRVARAVEAEEPEAVSL